VGNILQIGPVDISGLSPGTYYLSVKSYNQSGESGYSNEIAITWSVVPPTYGLSSGQKALIASNGNPQYFTIVFNSNPQRREETWVYTQLKKMYLFWDGALVDLRDVTINPNAYSNPPSLDPSLFTKDTQIQHVVQLFGSNYTTAGESDISSLLGPSDYKTIYYSDKGLFITFSGNDLTVVLTMDMPNK